MTQGTLVGKSRIAEATETQSLKQLVSVEIFSLAIISSYAWDGSASVQVANSPLLFVVCNVLNIMK